MLAIEQGYRLEARMLESGSIGFATAFGAGVISFLSPCVLPLVPGYLSYVAGASLESLRDRQSVRLRSLGFAVCFVLGFSLVFVAFGASATALGGLLLTWRYELGILAGVVVLLFGLHLAGLLPIHLLEREARFHTEIRGGRVVGAFLLGLAFAFGWTPCIGPVLGVILTMSASSANLATGTGLLAVYSLGLGLPFLLAALFTDVLLERLRQLSRTGRRLQRVAGVLLAVVGVLMITGRLEAMSYWLLETFPVLGRIG
jgi:cytochrome c-type biogenesis protein